MYYRSFGLVLFSGTILGVNMFAALPAYLYSRVQFSSLFCKEMSSMLYQFLPENCRIDNSDSIRACKGNVVKFLKIAAISILLFAVFYMAPAAAMPADSYEETETERNHLDIYVKKNYDRGSLLGKNSENTIAALSSIRETKSRSQQKKDQYLTADYMSYADESGDVFFSDSPVITGIHLPKGTTGSVSIMNEPESAGPNCREVYDVFDIFVENYPCGSESIIRYTLPLSEIEDRGYSPADIFMYFRDGETWTKLPTEYYMDSNNAFFESITTSLGVFAIVMDECESEIESVHLHSHSLEPGRVMLDISPVCILTHPVSYTATAD